MANSNETKSASCNEDNLNLSELSKGTTGTSNDVGLKWTCEYCTYANYPSALKCIMCKGQKPNLDIFRLNNRNLEARDGQDLGQDRIMESARNNYPLNEEFAEEEQGNSSTKISQLKSPSSDCSAVDGKWPCAVCTYLNWPIALRCTQCLTDRDKSSSPLLDSRNTQVDLLTAAAEHLQRTLTIDGGGSGAVARRKLPSPTKHSLCGGGTNSFSVTKWECAECTYENFPKSQKCSMCGSARPSTNSGATNLSHNLSSPGDSSQKHASSPVRVSPSVVAGAGGYGSSHVAPSEESKSLQMNNKAQKTAESAAVAEAALTQTNSLTRQKTQQHSGNNSEERQLLRRLRKHGDWRWLHACLGVVENNAAAVEEYLSYGGSPGRALTQAEVSLLNRNSAFDVGFTLIHLAIRFQREDMLPMMLSQISGNGSTGIKRVPSYVAPDLASDIRRQFSAQLRISRKGQFHCHFVQEHATFALPSEIEDLPVSVQEQLYEELLDKDAQKQLETPPPVVNWSLEITVRLGSRLVVLWNRSAGDCLLDSTMQATWGIFDRDNVLRRALADSLHQCAQLFYPRWKEYEMIQASLMHFQLEEEQWQNDWANLLAVASQPGASLEQLHIFALAHIFRRPIIVYGVKMVKSFRGEDIGLARFEGVYLPLLWEPSFCTKSPIALGYTRGHFSALVPTESYSSRLEASSTDEEDVTFLPLMDCDMKLLPIHFINELEMGREESLMRQWLDVCITEGGLMVAQQKLSRPLLVAQMTEEWLNYYRRLAQVITAPFARRPAHQLTGYSSDGDTEED